MTESINNMRGGTQRVMMVDSLDNTQGGTQRVYVVNASDFSGPHDLGYYETPEALQTAHPTAEAGDWAMVGSTDTVWTWDSDTSAWVDTGTSNAADRNLSNLTNKGANIGNWSHNVSNCVAEIPQDINLTLSSGTLTLKAGSKVYVPNGAAVFDTLTTTVDATYTYTGNGVWFVFVDTSGNIYIREESHCYGGTSAPSAYTNMVWYDTTENLVKYTNDSGSTWNSRYSLPVCKITVSNGAISSIDQVFNGFGYIGRQVFALPGVKALCVNGRNADGTLKSTLVTLTSVKVTAGYTCPFLIDLNGNFFPAFSATYAEQETQPSFQNGYWYNPTTNRINIIQSGVATQTTGAAVVMYSKLLNSNFVEYVKPVLPFRAVDYSNTNFIANQSMPSGRYTDVTLPASGSTVTAPADGYYTIAKKAGVAGEYLYMINSTTSFNVSVLAPNALYCRTFIPVSKGDVITINYSLTGDTSFFRFVYANGAK